MAETTETVALESDAEIFKAALAEPEAEVVTTTETVETTDGQPRDDQGRFAPKVEAKAEDAATTQTQTIEPAQSEPAKDDANVPSWRHREVSEERRQAVARAEQAERERDDFRRQFGDMQRRLTQLQQPKQEPVDFYADPDAAMNQRLTPVETQMQEMRQNFNIRASRVEAIAAHGKEAVAAMDTAISEAMKVGHPDLPLLRAQMLNSDDPVGIGMQWYQRDKLAKETGGDLTAYKQKLLDEALKDPGFQAKAIEAFKASQGNGANRSNNITQLPPSLNRVASAGSVHDDSGDMSDQSLFRQSLR